MLAILKTLYNLPSTFLKKKLYKKAQFWNRKTLEEYQNKQLIAIVKHAGLHVPYYRNLFAQIGFNANDFSGIADMHKIPFVDKEILRKHAPDFISDKSGGFFDEWFSTSGSTGTPLRFLFNRQAIIHKVAATMRAFNWAGYNVGVKVLSISDVSPDSETTYEHQRAARKLVYFSNQIVQDKVLSFHEKLMEFNPNVIWGYGYSILIFGKMIKAAGLPLPKLKSIINYGENISANAVKEIEELFETKLYDYYSHTEKVVIASQCTHKSLHLSEDFAYNEVVNHNGMPALSGELVGTTLTNTAMPLIRYKTGDIVELSETTCACGRDFKVLKSLEGRLHDGILTPDGRHIFLAEGALSASEHVIAGQYIQDSLEHVDVNIIVDNKFTSIDEDNIMKGLRLRLGELIKIDIHTVDSLYKKPNGKTPFIISKINNN